MFTKHSLNVSAISMSSEITFSTSEEISGSFKSFAFSTSKVFVCRFTFFEKEVLLFSKSFIVRYVIYIKITVGLLFFSYQTNTIILLFLIGYSAGIGFGVYKFTSVLLIISLCILLFMNEA